MDDYTKFIILNMISVVASCIVIGIACNITKSAWPLLALIVVPRWSWRPNSGEDKNKEDDQNE